MGDTPTPAEVQAAEVLVAEFRLPLCNDEIADRVVADRIAQALAASRAAGAGGLADAAREALEPFAREYEEWANCGDDTRPWIKAPQDDEYDLADYTVGDLRRASETFAALGATPAPEPPRRVEPNAARRCAEGFAQYLALRRVVLHEAEVRTLASMIEAAPTTPAPVASPRGEEVERVARALYEDEPITNQYGAWPEYPGDDGQRGDGYVRLVFPEDQEMYRRRARAAIAALRAARRPAPRGES